MRWTAALAVTVLTGGCTAGVSTELAEPVRPPGLLEVTELALLPVTAETGSQDAIAVVTASALELLDGWGPPPAILPPEVVRDRLGRAGLAATLARVLADYEATGIADADDLQEVARSLGTRHLLQLRVAYAESEVLREELFSEDVADERRRDVLLLARLWEAGGTAPLWEATARADSETGFLSTDLPGREAMLGSVARRLLERLPLAGEPPGDVRTPR